MPSLALRSLLVASITVVAGINSALAAEPNAATAASATPRPKICLVLSGGGARGVAHIGVLKVLEELRVPVDCIVGTSMGSLVGGGYAYGESPAKMEKLVREANWDNVLLDQPPRPDRSVRSKSLDRSSIGAAEFGIRGAQIQLPTGAIIGQQLEIFLQGLAGPNQDQESFDKLRIPFRAIATDIESGSMVVLDHGSLPQCLRASMSVPGVFSPVELDGRLLVDGGLTRNLGVDVARSMGADILIAVNLGTGLMRRDQIQSLLSVGSQMVNILTEQNVQKSLGELTERDVLILPQLGDYSAGDFEHSASTIEIGERAARAVEDRLRTLSLSEADYAAFLARVRGDQAPVQYAGVRLDTKSLTYVNPRVAEATFTGATNGQRDEKSLAQGLKTLLATDDFQQVRYRVDPTDGGSYLLVEPREKSWGPNYLHMGLTLSTNFQGTSSFNLNVDHRMTWLNDRGLEWRNRAYLGNLSGLGSELYQPLDLEREWFVAPRVVFTQQLDNIFIGDNNAAQYRNRRGEAGLDLGYRFGTVGEARLGYNYGKISFTKGTGSAILPDQHDNFGAAYLQVVLDQYDNWSFPSTGYLAVMNLGTSRPSLGSDTDYDTGIARLEKAFGTEKDHYRIGLDYYTSFDTERPIYDAFQLGGFLKLSGYSQQEFLVDGATMGRFVYEHRVAFVPTVAKGIYVGGSVEAANLENRLNGPEPGGVIYSGSLYLAADTILGPFYFAVGLAEGGNAALYLFLGRPL
ncbi:MAG TPA: patatin-like phospholipase family protein [Steroidobacteraceae bacterium]|nr:patatin-like phospholipase family protein [Steroidobacteraceae bacterium]